MVDAKDFKQGFIKFSANKTDKTEILNLLEDFEDFKDGFIAFSNIEKRAHEINKDFNELLNGRITGLPNVEGYLTEMDLWKNTESEYFEIYIERVENGFYYNYFHLISEKSKEGYENCLYREMKIYPVKSLFKPGDLSGIEVIIPEKRINIFITV